MEKKAFREAKPLFLVQNKTFGSRTLVLDKVLIFNKPC